MRYGVTQATTQQGSWPERPCESTGEPIDSTGVQERGSNEAGQRPYHKCLVSQGDPIGTVNVWASRLEKRATRTARGERCPTAAST
jgi:hypothetical protein